MLSQSIESRGRIHSHNLFSQGASAKLLNRVRGLRLLQLIKILLLAVAGASSPG